MSTLSIRLPNSLHRRLQELAEREGVSINQLINSAVGEKLAALRTEDYLARARRGNRKVYEGVLRTVPDIPAEGRDKLSNNRTQRKRPAQASKPRR
jgi:predicted transcriptional regulator